MARFSILSQGHEQDKDVWFANCVYGDADKPIRVVITGQAFAEIKPVLPSFHDVVGAAIDAAQELEFPDEIIEVSTVSPFFKHMTVRFGGRERE
jgi:hypothetical protein